MTSKVSSSAWFSSKQAGFASASLLLSLPNSCFHLPTRPYAGACSHLSQSGNLNVPADFGDDCASSWHTLSA